MQIIISGSSGFIGKNLIRYISKIKNKKFNIIALYNNNLPIKKYKNINYKQVNIEKDNNLKFINKNSIFIHLAWSNLPNYDSTSHIDKHLKFQKKFIKKVIEKKPKKLFVLGTCFEYEQNKGPIYENFKIKPVNNYAKGKNLLRKYIEGLIKKNTILTWARLFYVYGFGQQSHTLYSQYVNHKKNNKKLKIKNSSLELDYLPINKVVKYIFLLSIKNKKNLKINICSGRKTSIKNLINIWSKKKIQKNYKKNKRSFYGSNIKLKKFLSCHQNTLKIYNR